MLNGPARFLPGNHDLDLDATTSEHTFDTFRAKLGPEYHSYDTGKVHVVALNTVEYRAYRVRALDEPGAGVAAQRHRPGARGPADRPRRPHPAARLRRPGRGAPPGGAGAGDLRDPRGPRGRRRRRAHPQHREPPRGRQPRGVVAAVRRGGPALHPHHLRRHLRRLVLRPPARRRLPHRPPARRRRPRRPHARHQEHHVPGALHRARRGRRPPDGPRPEHPALPRVVRREPRQPRVRAGLREPARGLAGGPRRRDLADDQLLDGLDGLHRPGRARRR